MPFGPDGLWEPGWVAEHIAEERIREGLRDDQARSCLSDYMHETGGDPRLSDLRQRRATENAWIFYHWDVWKGRLEGPNDLGWVVGVLGARDGNRWKVAQFGNGRSADEAIRLVEQALGER